jgi:hypothetical protein
MSSNLPAGFFAAGGVAGPFPGPSARDALSARGSPPPSRRPSICITSPRTSVL